jgi:hypothetical protein
MYVYRAGQPTQKTWILPRGSTKITIIPVGFPSHQELTNGKEPKSSPNPAFCREFSLDLSDSSNQTIGKYRD